MVRSLAKPRANFGVTRAHTSRTPPSERSNKGEAHMPDVTNATSGGIGQ